MRVATSSLQLQWLADVYRQQNDIAKLQQQVTSGYKISTAADDPAGASAAVTLQQGIDRLKTYASGADTATRRLSLEENSLSQVQDTLTRVRELAVEAGVAFHYRHFTSLSGDDLASARDSRSFEPTLTLTYHFGSQYAGEFPAGTSDAPASPQSVPDNHPGAL